MPDQLLTSLGKAALVGMDFVTVGLEGGKGWSIADFFFFLIAVCSLVWHGV